MSVPLDKYGFEPGSEHLLRCAVLGVRPEHVLVGEAANNAPVVFDAEIEIVEPMGAETIAWTKFGGQELHIPGR